MLYRILLHKYGYEKSRNKIVPAQIQHKRLQICGKCNLVYMVNIDHFGMTFFIGIVSYQIESTSLSISELSSSEFCEESAELKHVIFQVSDSIEQQPAQDVYSVFGAFTSTSVIEISFIRCSKNPPFCCFLFFNRKAS